MPAAVSETCLVVDSFHATEVRARRVDDFHSRDFATDTQSGVRSRDLDGSRSHADRAVLGLLRNLYVGGFVSLTSNPPAALSVGKVGPMTDFHRLAGSGMPRIIAAPSHSPRARGLRRTCLSACAWRRNRLRDCGLSGCGLGSCRALRRAPSGKCREDGRQNASIPARQYLSHCSADHDFRFPPMQNGPAPAKPYGRAYRHVTSEAYHEQGSIEKPNGELHLRRSNDSRAACGRSA